MSYIIQALISCEDHVRIWISSEKMYEQREKGEKTKKEKKKAVPPNNFTCWNPKVRSWLA
jgi:hypothetical protein